jgi:hypothetical protein
MICIGMSVHVAQADIEIFDETADRSTPNSGDHSMSAGKPSEQIAAQVQTMQIIVFALCMGVVTFGGFVVFQSGGVQPGQSKTLTLAAVSFAVLGGLAGVAIPGFLVAAQRKKIAEGTWVSGNRQGPVPDTDEGKLLAVYQTKTIIRAAFFEGPAFLALLAYMTEGHPVNLGLAAALLAALLFQLPTVGRVEVWIADQLQRIKEQRQFSS